MIDKMSLYEYLRKDGIDSDLIQTLTPLFTHREYRKGIRISSRHYQKTQIR